MSKKEKLIFVLYFCAGMTMNCVSVGLPLFFATDTLGFTKMQIGTLASVIFLGSVCQPIIGYICDITGKKQIVSQCLFIGMSFIAIIMTFSKGFYTMLVLAFLMSVFKDPVIGLLDDITISFTNIHGGNYGKLRSGASWGYALGLFFMIPIEFILKDINFLVPVLTLIVMLSIIYIILQNFLGDVGYKNFINEDVSISEEDNLLYKKEVKEKMANKTYILLVLINFLLIGISSAKTSYQSLLLQDLGATTFLLSLANFIMVLPEILFMPHAKNILKDVSIKKVLYAVTFILMIMNGLLAIAENSRFVIAVVWMHGFSMAFFIPTFFVVLRRYLGNNISASGILINSMTQNLGTFLVGYFIITKIYSNFGFGMLFGVVVLLNALALIPITLLDEKKL